MVVIISPKISSKCVQYSREANKTPTLARDIGTTGHSEYVNKLDERN